MAEPLVATVGDTITWRVELADYPPAGGWVVSYSARGAGTFNTTAVADGAGHLVTITAAASAAFVSGLYTLQGYATHAGTGVRVTIYTGQLLLRPNVAVSVAGYDGRTHVQKVLAAIEATLEGRATREVLESEIDGLKLRSIPHDQLLMLREKYLTWARQEADALALAEGRRGSNQVLVRFV